MNYTLYPEIMTPPMLDDYLAKGWYRIGQTIMTADFSHDDGNSFALFWLRFNLEKYQHSKTATKILFINRHFQIIHKPYEITDEIQKMYFQYRSAIDFIIPESVDGYLLDGSVNNIYPTRLVEVRHEGRLIAAGYFDEGHEAAAGILSFYDTSYKKYSPGKNLMLEKINYCINKGKKYFYPGYISNAYPKFDYKLFPCKPATEIYTRNKNIWLPYLSVNMDELVEDLYR